MSRQPEVPATASRPVRPARNVGERVLVFDTTLRDGEQAAGVCFEAGDKVEIAERLDAMGVDVIEAGFPVNSVEEASAVRDVSLAVRDARVCALARAVPKDVAIAGDAIRDAAGRASTSS